MSTELAQIQLRRDTAANWTSTNPVLAAGERGFETDTGKEKVGDGSTVWTSLLYTTDTSRLPGSVGIGTSHNTNHTYVSSQGPRDFFVPADYRTAIDADDTNGVQLAGNAAIAAQGVLLLPAQLTLSSTITWGTSGGSVFSLNVMCVGSEAFIHWNGGSNSTIFQTWGMNKSEWSGIWPAIPTTSTGVTVFAHDAGTGQNTSNNTIRNCFIPLSTHTGIVGWNLGYTAASNTDISGWNWIGCKMTATTGSSSSGNIAWAMGGNNTLTNAWHGCGTAGLQKAWTSVALSGGSGFNAMLGWTINAPDCHGNWIDIDVAPDTSGAGKVNGTVKVVGGRIEATLHRIVNAVDSTTSTASLSVSLDGVSFYLAAATDDGKLFTLNYAGNFSMRHCQVFGSISSQIATLLEASCNASSTGIIEFAFNQLKVTSGTFWTLGTGTWRVTSMENQQINTSNTIAGVLANSLPWLNAQTVNVYTSNATWTKPVNTVKVTVMVLAGGGGGGSGRQTASGTAASGGAGGGGGAYAMQVFNAAELASTETISVGAGGTAGAAQASASTNGNAGGAGGASQFGNILRVQPGGGGPAGATASTSASAGGAGMLNGSPGAAGAGSAAGGNGTSGGMAAPGGGAGGGLAATPAVLAGGAGGASTPANVAAGGAGGTTDGQAGGAGTAISDLNFAMPGSAGGGGASSIIAAGGTGGVGAVYGAGGGGGGCSLNGFSSGAGGVGGAGIVVVISE